VDIQLTETYLVESVRWPPTDFELSDDYKVRYSITIQRPREEVFAFWRDFQNLALIFKDVESISVLSPRLTRWKVRLKNGAHVEWDAEIVEEIENRSISWSSTGGSKVKTAGTVAFEKGVKPNQTIVRLMMNYTVPGGKLTELATFFTGESPNILANVNLKRLKAFLETGTVPTVEGQPSGRREDREHS
jgi:uncharacterized membrane protein